MDTIVLFDPGIRSLNKGDEIIMRSAEAALSDILADNYVIKCATHAPAVTFYQNTRLNPRMKVYQNARYKFICGSNLMWKNMFKPRPVFNVNWFNCMPYEGSILLGVGVGQAKDKLNGYTKRLYSKILSDQWIHSVRDARAEQFVKDLGFQALNTGCPTMWKFTPEFCAGMPTRKSDAVIFTLTDYGRAHEADQKLIDILLANYKEVYFWIQGVYDKEYLETFQHTEQIRIVPPTIERFDEILGRDDIEYVGTRLHAGMFAMQHQKRTVILAIDNRVRDMKLTYDLNVLERGQIDQLNRYINSEIKTNLKINFKNIRKWFSQFEE